METAIAAVEANIKSINGTIDYYQKEADKYLKYKAESIEKLKVAEADYEKLKEKLGI